MTNTTTESGKTVIKNPLDDIEKYIELYKWSFERHNQEEIGVKIAGIWDDYALYFTWDDESEYIHLSCILDMYVDENLIPEVCILLMLINVNPWLGHFDITIDERNLPMFRVGLPLRGQEYISSEQIEDLIDSAITECERYYPAFQCVIKEGKTAGEALEISIVETEGNA